MILNEHSDLKGKHSFLSPSKVSWINYDENKLIQSYINSWASEVGTTVHEFAENCIKFRIKLGKTDRKLLLYHLLDRKIPTYVIDLDYLYSNVMIYVNDAIGFRMLPEVILAYSEYCFGTTDAISYNEKNKQLRIHDLKTGKSPVHIEQLILYAALFCLEYNIKPEDISTELRIYQQEIIIYEPEPDEINKMMDAIISNSFMLEKFMTEGR